MFKSLLGGNSKIVDSIERHLLVASRVILTAFLTISIPHPASAEDQVYQDSQWGFRVLQPTGWRAQSLNGINGANLRVSLKGPEAAQSGEVCSVTAMNAPATQSLTQTQVNSAIVKGVLADSVLNELRTTDSNATRLSAQVIQLGTVSAQQVEVRANVAPRSETKTDFITISIGAAIPGRTFFVNCASAEQNYARLKPELDRLVRSLRVTGN